MSFRPLKILSTNSSFTIHIYLIYIYQQDLALNNLQGLIWHKAQLTKFIVAKFIVIILTH